MNIAFHTAKTTYERGDIWYVEPYYQEGSEQRAGRPAIIVSNDTGNKVAPIVEVVYLTTREKNDQPTHVPIYSSRKPSLAMCEQITTVAKTRLGDFYGRCTADEMAAIDTALAVSVGLPAPPVETDVPDADTEKVVLRTERDLYKKLYEDIMAAIFEE